MASLLGKVQAALTTVHHEQPPIWHPKKILLALTSAAPQMPDHRTGFFWAELLHPYQVFTAKGWDVDIVSETGGATVDEASIGKMASPPDLKYWEDKQYPLHQKLAQMRAASQVQASDYAAIYFAGGHACCEDLPKASTLKSLVRQIYENGGVVGADCHGPAIFDGLMLSNGEHILMGKRATGFSTNGEKAMGALAWMEGCGMKTMQEIVTKAGGKWEEASNPMADHAVADGRIVTGMNPASAKSVAEQMLAYLPQDKEIDLPRAQQGVTHQLGVGDKTRAPDTVEKGRIYQGEKMAGI